MDSADHGLRPDGLLLAYLVSRSRPADRADVHDVIRGLGEGARRMDLVAQALIRAKLLDPRTYVALRARVEGARRVCRGCKRTYVAVPGEVPRVRRCPCGRPNRVPAITLRDEQPPAPQDDALSGSARFVGPYRVLGRLGDGGGGSIYRVANGEGERFALKLLHKQASASARERFRREAEILSRLSHPNVVKVHELAVDESNRPYFTMELVEGSTLQQLKARLEPEVLVGIVSRAAEGLHHAHEHGLVHRDVKPHNVVVGRKGAPKVVDFGLAHDVTANTLTQEGDLLGTPLYMAPEQLRGEHEQIDRRADVYSLGAMLYEGLCGRLPIVASSLVELQEAIRRADVPRPRSLNPEISPALEAVVLRALAHDPGDRHETALMLSLELRRALRRPHDAPAPQRVPGRLRWVALLAVLFGVLSLSLAGALFLRRKAAREDRARSDQRVRDTLASVRDGLERAQLVEDHAEAISLVREARAKAESALDERLRRSLGPQLSQEHSATALALGLECHTALALTLAEGPFDEREEARTLLAESLERDPEQIALWFALARMDDLDARPRRAQAAAREVVSRDTKHGDAQLILAYSALMLDNHEAAREALERALTGDFQHSSRADATAVLGWLNMEEGNLEEAQRLAAEAQLLDPTSQALSHVKYYLALQANDEPQACRVFEALIARKTLGVRALDACVRYLVEASDWELATTLLDDRLAIDANPQLVMLRGVLHHLQSEHDAARAAFDRSAECVPIQEPLAARLKVYSARNLLLRGQLDEAIRLLQGHLDSGKATASLSVVAELINLLLQRDGPQDVERAEDQSSTLDLSQGFDAPILAWRIALARSDLKAAERARRRLPKATQKHPYVIMLEARYLAALGRGDQLGILHKSMAGRVQLELGTLMLPRLGLRSPFDSAVERLQRGCRLFWQARATGAEETLRRAGRLFADARALIPELACAELLRIAVEAELGAAPDVLLKNLAALERPGVLLVGAPGFPPAQQHLEQLRGRQLLRANRGAEAVQAYTRALAVGEPASRGRMARKIRLHLERAEAYESIGDAKAALADLDRALQINTRHEDARARRQRLRADTGDTEGARQDAELLQALRAGPVAEVAEAVEGLALAKTPLEGDPWARQLRELQSNLDPVLHAELFAEVSLARAKALFRWHGIGPAFDDLALVCQWNDRGLELVYDLVGERLGTPRQREQLLQVVTEPPDLPGLDLRFRAGFGGFLLAEFFGVSERAPMSFLRTDLTKGPASASSALMLAAMETGLGYRARGRAVLSPLFDLPEVPPFAHYLQAREALAGGNAQAALEWLGKAWDSGFQPKRGYRDDPRFESLHSNPAFSRFLP